MICEIVLPDLALENKITAFLTATFGDDGKLWRKDVSDSGKSVVIHFVNEGVRRMTCDAFEL